VSGTVTSATLKLYVRSISNSGTEGEALIYPAGDGWTETGITWNNAPSADTENTLIDMNGITAPGYVNFSSSALTTYVSQELAGDETITFVMYGKDSTSPEMNDREHTEKPILTVETGGSKNIAPSQMDDFMQIVIPDEFGLSNYPNPFNPSTTINYSLPESGQVSLTVYNMTGRTIKTLVNGVQNAGEYSYVFETLDANGNQLPSGLYMCRLHTGSFVKTIKMMFVR
jgi:hypothetical protein